MKIAVEGCAHGELDKIYESIQFLEKQEDIKVDLLICCGDFQATRNNQDLRCMSVPVKYQKMCTFYKYYSGEKTAPILTIFIGGNHEASNYLQELAYGGWVAPNIYYMGYASIVNVGGVRIGGISGIYKGHDYMKGHFEKAPYTEETKRSVYHVRNLEVFRLKQVKEPIDIMCSHDWPRGIYNYGNIGNLLEMKPFFMEDIQNDKLGSKPCEELLHELKPKFWFSAHLHVKFVAIVPHPQDGGKKKVTKFLALDKCIPKRKFLQILDIPSDADKPIRLEYDLEWLTIVHLTNHLLSVKKGLVYMPGKSNHERWIFTPTSEEQTHVLNRFNKDLEVPLNFTRTVAPFDENSTPKRDGPVKAQINPQTMLFCERLGVDDPMAILLEQSSNDSTPSRMSLPSFLTPDKSENVSQWSSPPSQSDDVTSIDNLDLSLNNSNSSQIMKRSSLSMPAPKLCANDEDFLPLTRETTMSSSPEESNDEMKSKSLTLSKCSSLSMSAPKLSTNSEDSVPLSRETTMSSSPEETKSESPTSRKRSSLSMPAPKLSTNSEDSVPLSRETTTSSSPEGMKSESLISSKRSSLSLLASRISDEEIVHPVMEKSKSPRSDIVEEAKGPVADIQQDQTLIPVVKKFKRRNQALYTNIEED